MKSELPAWLDCGRGVTTPARCVTHFVWVIVESPLFLENKGIKEYGCRVGCCGE
jgi:hypothetical protein